MGKPRVGQSKIRQRLPHWSLVTPIVAWLIVVGSFFFNGVVVVVLSSLGLLGAVMASVHHAETVAHRIGEPFGTLVLAVAVTMIEVALIVALMFSAGKETTTLARDTVFASVMILLNGIVGLCLLVGGVMHGEQSFGLEGVSTSLTTLAAITVLTLLLPNFTVSIPGPYYDRSQLAFIAVVSLALYGTFVLVQSVRHRYYFVPDQEHADNAPRPTVSSTVVAGVFLLVSLVVVVVLAKSLAPDIESVVIRLGAPKALVGIVIACVVLLPEGSAALRAARSNRLQTSLNLALGSALASIGLTIPAVAGVSLVSGLTLTLGIDVKSMVLLLLSMFVTTIALNTGKTTIMQGAVLLVIFAVYLFTTVVP